MGLRFFSFRPAMTASPTGPHPIRDVYETFIAGLENIASELKADGALNGIDKTVFALAFAGAINSTALQLIRMNPRANVRDAAASVRAMFSHLVE